MPGFIDDGYTRQGYIKPLEPFHEGLRFEYRPATISDRNRILSRVAACGGNKPEQVDKAIREASKAVVERGSFPAFTRPAAFALVSGSHVPTIAP